MSLYLKVEVLPGTSLSAACEKAVELARKLGIAVEMDFNMTAIVAFPESLPADLGARWYRDAERNKEDRRKRDANLAAMHASIKTSRERGR